MIVFFVGGVTYEEAKTVAFFNEVNPDVRVIVGGTTLHNFARLVRGETVRGPAMTASPAARVQVAVEI